MEKLIKLAKDYAKELEPKDAIARTFCENDLIAFINYLLNYYFIIEKDKILEKKEYYEHIKDIAISKSSNDILISVNAKLNLLKELLDKNDN